MNRLAEKIYNPKKRPGKEAAKAKKTTDGKPNELKERERTARKQKNEAGRQ